MWEHITASRPQSIAGSLLSPAEETGGWLGDIVDRRPVFAQRSTDRHDRYHHRNGCQKAQHSRSHKYKPGFGRKVSAGRCDVGYDSVDLVGCEEHDNGRVSVSGKALPSRDRKGAVLTL